MPSLPRLISHATRGRDSAGPDGGGQAGTRRGAATPPVNANTQAEYIELNAQIAKAEAKLAADEALADAQERDLRREGVTDYESARVTGKLREWRKSPQLPRRQSSHHPDQHFANDGG